MEQHKDGKGVVRSMPKFLRFNAPVQHMNFIYFGGITRIKPPILSIVQTDGLFQQRTKTGAAGVLLIKPDHTFSSHIEPLYGVASSMEAEWASIHLGLSVAAQTHQPAIGLENDCLGIIGHIALNSQPSHHEYAKYYHHKIRELSRRFEWCGIRWIPKEQNRANKLLR